MSGRGLILAALLAMALPAASPPEVVPVRVSSDRAASWFPPGAQMRGMSFDQFDRLVRDARAGSTRRDEATGARLLRAAHEARWENGVLIGRSTLVIDPALSGISAFALEPWTPAIESPTSGPSIVLADDAGRTLVRLEETKVPETKVVEWRLRSRPGSRGRRFSLGLPGTEGCTLRLELPEGMIPQGLPGLRQGPTAAAIPNHARWLFAGKIETTELLLTSKNETSDEAPKLWVEGPTRIELRDNGADWTTRWSIGDTAESSQSLDLALDAGLEPTGVAGADVEGFQAEAMPDGSTRVKVQLRAPSVRGLREVEIQARASVPVDGKWLVPAARPLNGVWTGGTTTIRLDSSRAIEAVRPLAGRESSARPSADAQERLLTFEADRAAAVAEIVFRRSSAEVSARVQGHLVVGNSSPRLTARVFWRIDHGRPHELALDLPASWVADRVGFDGVEGPVSWHRDDLAGGGTRLHVIPPSGDWSGKTLTLTVSAASMVAGGRGPLALPRVWPVSARVAEETWSSATEEDLALIPRQARGLAWIEAEPATTGARASLAWRWLTDDAEARVDRIRPEAALAATVQQIVTVRPERLALQARLGIVVRGEPSRSLIFGLSEPISDSAACRLLDEATGLELPLRSLDSRERAASGVGGTGPAWSALLPGLVRGRVGLVVRYEGPWAGKGRIPLVFLPDAIRARGTALLLTGRDVRLSVESSGVTTLDPDVTAESLNGEAPLESEKLQSEPSSPYRRAHAFAYEGANGWVDVKTTPLAAVSRGDVIREALLTTLIKPRGPVWQRLALKVVPGRAPTLDVALPPGAQLERARLDGQSVAPLKGLHDEFSVPLRAGAGNPAGSVVVVTLDYLTPGLDAIDTMRVWPVRPRFSMPCLGLTWKLVTPERWRLADWGEALTSADAIPAQPAFVDRLARGRFAWNSFLGIRRRSSAAAANAISPTPDNSSLGEALTRWDGGKSPVVIDRLALADAGGGPRSRAAIPKIMPETIDMATRSLAALGLRVIRVGRTRLVTTINDSAATADRRALETAVEEAVAWGSDASDRYQSVSRWREEPNPRPGSAEDTDEFGLVSSGHHVRLFAASGWPEQGAGVTLVDERGLEAWGWAIGFGTLALGLLASRSIVRAPSRAAALAFLVAGALLVSALAPVPYSGAAAGLLGGAVGLVLLALGQALPGLNRWPLPGRLRRQGSSITGRRGTKSLIGAASLVLAAAGAYAATSWAFGQEVPGTGGKAPILALFAYDGLPEVTRPPARVLLRLEDYVRLASLAESAPAPVSARLMAASATHKVWWTRMRHLMVESELRLVPEGSGLLRWSFPVEDARDIEAVLDGESLPIRIEPGGRVGSIQIDAGESSRGGRNYLLRIRRRIVPNRGDRGESISLAVNAIASARFETVSHPAGLRLEVPTARGQVEVGSNGASGWLGPIGRLDLTWSRGSTSDVAPASGSVDGVVLWDATPAGDRVRAKLTYRNPGGTSVIRLQLGAGVIVRGWKIPGDVDISRTENGDKSTWIARVDPPLPDGGTVLLDAWRQSGIDAAGGRSIPRIDPIGVERISHLLALRRPADWEGRLSAGAGGEVVSDEAFLRAWGTPTAEPLILSGAIRLTTPFSRLPAQELSIHRTVPRFLVTTNARATLSQGRVELAVDAELAEIAGAPHEVEVAFPDGFRIVRFDADGLTDWTDAGPSKCRLSLRFDGPAARTRKVHIQGWLPVPFDPLATSQPSLEAPFPWLHWLEQEEKAGTLVVVSSSRVPAEGISGVEVVSTEPQGDSSGAPFHVAYRINDPSVSGRIMWPSGPLRVTVQLQSALMVDPAAAEWLAVLQYDVASGPLDTINLRLPSEWAKSATVRLDNLTYQRVTETRGENTFWSIRPERPIWGAQRLLVRSTLPFPRGAARAFPDLSPLGRGAVETYLRVVNQVGQPLTAEGSLGVQPVALTSLPVDEALAARALSAAATTAYHVVKPGWSLRIAKRGDAIERPGEPEKRPSADHVEIACTLAADGSSEGMALCDVERGAGAFLPVRLARAAPLWASVNGSPARLLKAGPDEWLIPLVEESESRVRLAWQGNALPSGEVALPLLGRTATQALVTVRAPGGLLVESPSGRLPASVPERMDIERARWNSIRAQTYLKAFDRSSRRAGENLVATLVAFELGLRQAERSASWDLSATPAERASRAARARVVSDQLRLRLASALRDAGLEDYQASALFHVGLTSGETSETVDPGLEPAPSVQVRPLGVPFTFLGELRQDRQEPWIAWKKTPAAPPADAAWILGLFLLTLAAPAMAFGLTRITHASRWSRLVALGFGLGAIAAWSGPWWLAAGAGTAILGRAVKTAG